MTRVNHQEEGFLIVQIQGFCKQLKLRLQTANTAAILNKQLDEVQQGNAGIVDELYDLPLRKQDLKSAIGRLETHLADLAATKTKLPTKLKGILAADMLLVRRNIIFLSGPRKALRAGVIANMTVGEYRAAVQKQMLKKTDHITVCVKNHKNACKGSPAAPLILEPDEWYIFATYFKVRCALYGEPELGAPFLVGEAGTGKLCVTQDLLRLSEHYLQKPLTCTQARKAISTSAKEVGATEDERLRLAGSMSHTMQTANRHYAAPTPVSMLRDYNAMKNIRDRMSLLKKLKNNLLAEFPEDFPQHNTLLNKKLNMTKRYVGLTVDEPMYQDLAR